MCGPTLLALAFRALGVLHAHVCIKVDDVVLVVKDLSVLTLEVMDVAVQFPELVFGDA